jgi:hypothetical protein
MRNPEIYPASADFQAALRLAVPISLLLWTALLSLFL